MGRALSQRSARRGRGASDLAAMTADEKNTTASHVERVARESYGRLLAHLAAAWRDVASAEDLWPRHLSPP